MTAASQQAKVTEPKPALDDLMLAMDIVDTLRHDMRIAERELGDDQRREALKKRLRDIYGSQGIEVPDDILEDGVRALEQDRFTYKSRASGLSAALARAYVNRAAWARRLAVLLLLGLAAWGGWYFGVERPRQMREAALAAEIEKGAAELGTLMREIGALNAPPELLRRAEDLAEKGRKAVSAADRGGIKSAVAGLEAIRGEAAELAALPGRIDKLAAAIRAETKDDNALVLLATAESGARQSAANADIEGARTAFQNMEGLLRDLRRSYKIRVVQEEGTPSGVWRVPDVNQSARNYYLIVEAIGPDGKPIEMRVLNEETKKPATVMRWGVRVPEKEFNAVRRDKSDDGIIQNDTLAQKPRGTLTTSWVIPAPQGEITEW